ncbi:MAG: cation diffusion facilitator family transporter [bacterium]
MTSAHDTCCGRSPNEAPRRDQLEDDAPAVGHDHDHCCDNGHDHGGHDHGDNPGHSHDFRAASRKALSTALVLLAAIFVAELIGGLLSGSLALLADAAHLLTDVAAIALALVAQWFAKRPSNASRSYGFRRAEILAALINGVTLWGISIYIVYEAIGRVQNPPPIASAPMVAIATVGLVVQTIAAVILARASGESLNVKGAYVHAATDAVQSAAVVVVGLAMMATGWWLLDPVVSILIAVLIAWSGGKLAWEATHVLLEGTPPELDLMKIARTICAQEGVAGVADLHAWSITTGYNALSAHVLSEPTLTAERRETLRQELARRITASFAVHHVTLQVETRCTLSDVQNCCGWLSASTREENQ